MLRRWFKVLALQPNSESIKTYHNCKDFFTTNIAYDRSLAAKVISNYKSMSQLFQYAQHYKGLTSEKFFKDSIINLKPLIPLLELEEIVVLSTSLSNLKIRDHEIWDLLEAKMLTADISEISIPSLISLINSFGSTKKKNTELWQKLEEAVLEKVYTNDSILNLTESLTVYRAFVLSRNGSDFLFDCLKANIQDRINIAGTGTLNQLTVTLSILRKNADESLLVPIIDKILFISHSPTPDQVASLIRGVVRMNFNEELLVKYQVMAEPIIPFLELSDLQALAYSYYVNLTEDILKMRKISDFITILEKSIVKKLKNLDKIKDSDIKASLVFLSVGKLSDQDFWQSFVKMTNNRPETMKTNINPVLLETFNSLAKLNGL